MGLPCAGKARIGLPANESGRPGVIGPRPGVLECSLRVYSRGHPLTPPSLGEGPRKKQEARRKKTGGLVDLDWRPGPGEPGVNHGWKEEEEPGWHEVPRMQDGLETPLDGGLYFTITFGAEKLSVYAPVFFKTINYVN